MFYRLVTRKDPPPLPPPVDREQLVSDIRSALNAHLVKVENLLLQRDLRQMERDQ